MQIGKVIRKYRKAVLLTQEEMADRLGVTASAVNKWENGVSLPDILLLAPIARLLGITPDTLLAFREDLTEEELRRLIYELDERLQKESYEEAFSWAKKKIEEYPNCGELRLSLAVILDAGRILREVPDAEAYDAWLETCYVRSLDCEEESIRLRAAESLFGFYLRKEQYEKAEKCLTYFSDQNPEKKGRRAELYAKTGRGEDAAREYEELLFFEYQRVNLIFVRMSLLAQESGDRERVRYLAEKQRELARLFEMGKYYESAAMLGVTEMEKDADACSKILTDIRESLDSLGDFSESSLFKHMEFKKPRGEFLEGFRKNFEKLLKERPAFELPKENIRD